jgi:glycosyltransferase involved in cell wall biosynthesis
MMKLLYVHDRFGAFGGAEANILATAEELRWRGWTVGLLHGPNTGKGESSWNSAFEPRFPLASPQAVGSALARFQPDLIYLHNLADLVALEALLASGVPVAKMVHDHSLYCMRSYKYNYFTRRICQRAVSPFCVFPCAAFLARDPGGRLPVRWVSYAAKRRELDLNRKFRHLIVATHFMQEELLRNGFEPGRIEVHPPVPRAGDPGKQSSFSNRNLIVYSGQITRGKGVDVLLEALARLRVPFECLIFGDGGYRGRCERLCRKLGLSHRVTFKGFVSPEEIAQYYSECSVVVMSSVWPEPFGAAGLEGMRYGLPVVAFDAGGIKEWLTDGVNGFLVPWMDRSAYAAKVEALLQDKALARAMGECGRQAMAQSFSFARYVDGLEALFTRAAARSGRQSPGYANLKD